MSKSIQEIMKIINDFCEQRDWSNDNPTQLVTSIFIELGELAEHYQWEDKFKELSDEEKKMIGYEFVDVIFYLFRLAGKTGINIEEAFEEKLPKLAKKFPPGKDHIKAHKEYREAGKNKLY